MHLIVINPNTTASMTRLIGGSARAVAAPGTTVTAVNPDMGPASIESHYDEALSVPGLLAEIAQAQAGEPAADGFVIACFGDPGLDAARELADGPVVGIAEAAMHAASFLGPYTARGILPIDPFVSIDRDGVGELVRIGVERGRKTRRKQRCF